MMIISEPIVSVSTEVEPKRWDAFVASAGSGHLMQSCPWGDFKAASGWQVERLILERDRQIVGGAQLLLRPLPWLPLTMAYLPKGPLVDPTDEAAAATLFAAIHQVNRRRRAIFLRIEPNWPDENHCHTLLKASGLQPTPQTNQPRSTLIISLADGEKAVLARMRKKTRQLIQRAIHAEVQIVEGGSQDIDSFYQVLSSTADLKKFSIHNQNYYRQLWQAFQQNNSVKLLLAQYQAQTVAAKMIFAYGNRTLHLFGGTSPLGREVGASYLIQWEALKWAMAQGYQYADLWGIPDELADMVKSGQEIPKDRQTGGLWGVYNFKRGFGGEIESYVGAYDYVYSPLPYWLGVKLLTRTYSVDFLSKWLEAIQR